MLSQQSAHGAPHEDIDLHPNDRIKRWIAEVTRESKKYHDYDTPYKSIEISDDYGSYPAQKFPLAQLQMGCSVIAGMPQSIKNAVLSII